jgi:hypothetical protein
MPQALVDERLDEAYDYRALPPSHSVIAMVTPKNKDKSVVGWISLVVLVLSSVIGGTIWLDSKFSAIDSKLGDTNTKIVKLQGAVNTLSAEQPEWIKNLIQQLIAVAQVKAGQGDTASAIQAAKTVAVLLGVERREKKPANDPFFLQTLAGLDTLQSSKPIPNIKAAALEAKLALANYRSSLESVPPNFSGSARHIVNGAVFTHNYFENAIVELDGRVWIDNTFVNSRIIYHGGPVEMQGTRFVNCTFEVTKSGSGWADRLLEYAIVGSPELKLAGHPS